MQKGAARPSLLCLPPYPLPRSAVIPATHRITSLPLSLLPFFPSPSFPPYLSTSLPPYLHLLPLLPYLSPSLPPSHPSVPQADCARLYWAPHHAAFTPLWVRVLVWPGEVGANNVPCSGL